ncbi:MAG: xanthine dehydrogenase family protein molybdopterin-binding subunit [Thermodesulfobacteriota bacterium]|jgi:CO/xanthine dehydrogenase Mo-binding subunit
MAELSIVGKDVIRVDALEKVTGKAKYSADFNETRLYAKVLRSPHAHANIINIDTSNAEKFPGVRGIVKPQDSPAKRMGFVVCSDRQVLPVDGRIRYIGEPVAVVVADSQEIAEEALELVKVDYEVLPAVFDPEEAMRKDCPVILHPGKNTYGSAMKFGPKLEREIPNVCTVFRIRKGDIEKGFQEADAIVENKYSFDGGSHGRMERYTIDAWAEGNGTLVVRTNRHRMWGCHGWLCSLFGLSPSKVRVITPYVGGSFGGKGSPIAEALALLAAVKTGKRVRLEYTREEDIFDTGPRPVIIVYVKDGVKKDGTIVARQTRFIINIGAYGSDGGAISTISCFNGIISSYNIQNWHSDSFTVYTNNPPTGTMRGVEAPQGNWAIESNIDCMAHRIGMDSLKFRLKNLVREGDTNTFGQVLHHISPKECLEKTAELMDWGKKSIGEGKWKRGKGLAIGHYRPNPNWPSSAIVKVFADGTIEVRIGTDEVGQGLLTVITQIAAEQFKVPMDKLMEKVKVVHGDTLYTPWDFGSGGSRATWMTGNAVIRACQDAKQKIFTLAAPKFETSPNDLDFSDGKVYHKDLPQNAISLSNFFRHGVAGEIGEILGIAGYEIDHTEADPETGYNPRGAASWSYLVYGVEVGVNTETGEVKVLRVHWAVDIGQPINWKMCEGQVEGSIGMGIACTLYEKFEVSNGKILNPNLVTYRMPTFMECPVGENVKGVTVGLPHPDGPYGAKALGEMGLVPFAAAVGNAVFDAIGVRITDAPITRERVFKALQTAKRAAMPKERTTARG